METNHIAPQNESLVLLGEREPGFQLWEFQTRLLACQFGLFSGDMRLRREARLSFSRLHMVSEVGKQSQWGIIYFFWREE